MASLTCHVAGVTKQVRLERIVRRHVPCRTNNVIFTTIAAAGLDVDHIVATAKTLATVTQACQILAPVIDVPRTFVVGNLRELVRHGFDGSPTIC